MKHLPYNDLANAIIEMAVKDYLKAQKRIERHPENERAAIIKKECERFFRSEWFGCLTDMDPDYLLKQIARMKKGWQRIPKDR